MKKIIFIFLFLLAIPCASFADVISMEITTSATVRGSNDAAILVSAVNRGNKPAQNVRIDVVIESKQYSGKTKTVLGAGERYAEEFIPSVELKKQGRYNFIVSVSYTDEKFYPFSAISAGYMNYRYMDYIGYRDSGLSGEITELAFYTKDSGTVIINNQDKAEKKLKYELIASKDFIIEQPKGEITIGPGMKTSIPFTIKNISGLAGSKYPVFALLNYEDDDYHYSAFISGIVRIEKINFFKRYNRHLIALLAGLLIIFAYYNLRGFIKSKSV